MKRVKFLLLLLYLMIMSYLLYPIFKTTKYIQLGETIESIRSKGDFLAKTNYYSKACQHRGDIYAYKSCMTDAKLVRIFHYEDGVISAVYRCSDKEKVGELKISKFKTNRGETVCSSALFDKSLNVAIGDATDYKELDIRKYVLP